MTDHENRDRSLESDYRALFDSIPSPIFILDRKNLKILECNKSVRTVYGYCKEEILQTSFLRLFEEGEHQNYALELRNSEILNYVGQVTKEGKSIFVNIVVSPYQHLGSPALVVLCTDIIRILRAKQQLVQASKMATLGEMSTGIAHELNQPLSVIKTASSFLLSRVEKGERIKDEVLKLMLEEVDMHADRASGIISHIREFGRKSDARREEVQVNVAIHRALEIFSQQLKLRRIEVFRDLDENLPTVMADLNRLEQVFINLLINARDAIEEKREKFQDMCSLERITVSTKRCGETVRIEISDTGIGIPDALLDRIFEPFFTTKEGGKGTGLGLSISDGIVQDYQGMLQVETEADKGSTFIVQFPIQVNSNG